MLPDHCKLRCIRPRGPYRVGDVIDYPRGPAKSLIVGGDWEYLRDEPQLLEVAMVEKRPETADTPRRRGRKPR